MTTNKNKNLYTIHTDGKIYTDIEEYSRSADWIFFVDPATGVRHVLNAAIPVHIEQKVAEGRVLRCQALAPDGEKCYLQAGHDGLHVAKKADDK